MAIIHLMESNYRLKTAVAFLFFVVVGYALSACSVTTVIVPTPMAVAAVPTASATAVSPQDLPITFTPHPNATTDIAAWTLSPSDIPSVTPTIPTSTPRPSSTPTPSNTPIPSPTSENAIIPVEGGFPPQRTGRDGSRLGVHVVRHNHANIMNFVRRARPAVIKAVDDLGWLEEVKDVSPQTITIGRVDDIWIQNYIGTPEEAARQYVNKHLRTYQLNPGVDYWEGWNEPDPGLDRMGWYARFEQERVRLMARHGFRSAIGGFPPGVPEINEFARFIPAIETAMRYQGILTLHEGDTETGDMRYLYGSALPGYPAYPDRGALSFRYRWFYRELLEPAGLRIPLIVSELEFAGWHTTNRDHLIYDQLAWYDSEAQKDPYMLGFAVFTAGANSQWENFNLNSILLELARYVNSQ